MERRKQRQLMGSRVGLRVPSKEQLSLDLFEGQSTRAGGVKVGVRCFGRAEQQRCDVMVQSPLTNVSGVHPRKTQRTPRSKGGDALRLSLNPPLGLPFHTCFSRLTSC